MYMVHVMTLTVCIILWTRTSPYIVLTTLTSGPNFCLIVAENAAPANNRR